MLRLSSWVLSFVLHGALALSLVSLVGGNAFHEGSGDDMFVVEQGIAVDGTASQGMAQETITAVEVEPQEASIARPKIEEVKAEEVEEKKIVSSEAGPEHELKEIKEPEEVKEQRPEQTATLEQAEQVAVEEQKSAGAAKQGGDTTAYSAYLGRLSKHLEKNKVNPRTRIAGTVVIRFSVDAAGQLKSREVVESSGSKALDDAAIQSVDRAAPFPPFPEQSRNEPMVVSVPFKFLTR